jgi:hypothetical protein
LINSAKSIVEIIAIIPKNPTLGRIKERRKSKTPAFISLKNRMEM